MVVNEHDGIGHRSRLRGKFMNASDSDVFLDYEILEMLLFFVDQRKDTKKIAKSLLKKFRWADFHTANAKMLAEIMTPKQVDKFLFLIKLILIFNQRVAKCNLLDGNILSNWSKVIKYISAQIGYSSKEKFLVVYLNSQNLVIKTYTFPQGTVSGGIVYPREIVQQSLDAHATKIIVAHNHPSGCTNPSKEDIDLTNSIIKALNAVDIEFVDHIIVSGTNYFSFRNNLLI